MMFVKRIFKRKKRTFREIKLLFYTGNYVYGLRCLHEVREYAFCKRRTKVSPS